MGARPVTPEQDTCAQTSVHQSILNFFDEKGKPKGGHYRMASLLRQNRQGWKIRVSKTRCFEKLRQQQEQSPVRTRTPLCGRSRSMRSGVDSVKMTFAVERPIEMRIISACVFIQDSFAHGQGQIERGPPASASSPRPL